MRLEETDEPTDQMLIERTLEGDENAYAIIVRKYQKKIYRIAYAIVRSEMEADLVTQDTFVQAYLNLRKFEGRSELETWLTRIAINRGRDSLRSRRWLPIPRAGSGEEDLEIEIADERPDAERQLMSRQMRGAIERAVHSLSAQQKTIFRLRHFENLPLEEIASLMCLRPGTVRTHLFRAIHKVRQELAEWGPAGKRVEDEIHEAL